MNLCLKPLTRERADDYYSCRTAAFSHYYSKYGIESCNPERASSRILLEGFRQNLEGTYSAWYNDSLVGGVQVYPPFIIGTRCRISSLFVVKEFQQFGLGGQIMQEVERMFGSNNLELEVIREESFLLHFYEMLGYRVSDAPRKVGLYAHVLTMQKGGGHGGLLRTSDLNKLIMSA